MSLQVLARTPVAFRSAYEGLGTDRFALSAEPGEWSAAEILIHVRAADAVIAPRLIQVLVRPGVALPAVDERTVGHLLARSHASWEESIAVFTAKRRELSALLDTLTEEEWSLQGDHEVRGTVTVRDLCASIADHEREHVAQLDVVVAKVLGG